MARLKAWVCASNIVMIVFLGLAPATESFAGALTNGERLCLDLFKSTDVTRARLAVVATADANSHNLFSLKIHELQREMARLDFASEIEIRKLDSGRYLEETWPTLDPNIMLALSIAVLVKTPDSQAALEAALRESPQLVDLTYAKRDADISLIARHLVASSTATNLSSARQFLYRILHDRGSIRSPFVSETLETLYQHGSSKAHARYAIEKLLGASRLADDVKSVAQLKAELRSLPEAIQAKAALDPETLEVVVALAKQGRAVSEPAFREFLDRATFFSDFSAYSKNIVIFQLDRETSVETARMILLKRKAMSNPSLEGLMKRYEALQMAAPLFLR